MLAQWRTTTCNDQREKAYLLSTILQSSYCKTNMQNYCMNNRDNKNGFVLLCLDGGTRLSSIDQLADRLDRILFRKVDRNSAHVLHPLLSPRLSTLHNLRQRDHSYSLSIASTSRRRNFITRMLFQDSY